MPFWASDQNDPEPPDNRHRGKSRSWGTQGGVDYVEDKPGWCGVIVLGVLAGTATGLAGLAAVAHHVARAKGWA